jgi:phage terminase small subunit
MGGTVSRGQGGIMSDFKELTPKQALFVREYLVDYNGTQAATRCGYSPKTANEQAARLLANASIRAEIKKELDKAQARTEITIDYVLRKIKNTIERCEQSEPVLDREGNPTGEYKFDANAVLKGSELLGKHLGAWTDKIEHSGGMTVQVVKFGGEPQS